MTTKFCPAITTEALRGLPPELFCTENDTAPLFAPELGGMSVSHPVAVPDG